MAGHDMPRTWRSMQDETAPLCGVVVTVTPTARPICTATPMLTLVSLGVPHAVMNEPLFIGPSSWAFDRFAAAAAHVHFLALVERLLVAHAARHAATATAAATAAATRALLALEAAVDLEVERAWIVEDVGALAVLAA